MLILTRRPGQLIRIEHDITIVVLNSNGLNVRLGISAPPEIIINRQEIYDRSRGLMIPGAMLFSDQEGDTTERYPDIYLTELELRFIREILLGSTDRAIGEALGWSLRTVRFYYAHMQTKLQCHSQRELVEKIKNFT